MVGLQRGTVWVEWVCSDGGSGTLGSEEAVLIGNAGMFHFILKLWLLKVL